MKFRHVKFVVVLIGMVFFSCAGRTCRCTCDQPSRGNQEEWHGWLQVREADPGEAIATTQTQISNVSPEMAAAKILEALESYDGELKYRLSTVYTVAQTDTAGGNGSHPAVTSVVVGGHYYYVGFLDYPADAANREAYNRTNGQIPAVGVVDAENPDRPAWIRTEDDDGHAYTITLYFGTQAELDDNNIFRFLRNRGYGSAVSDRHRIDNPTLEFDESWRPYFTATYCIDDAYGIYGEAFYPEEFLLIDAQTREMQVFAFDNPKTDENERDQNIPEWVDQVYSPRLILDWIAFWGFNPDNHGVTSDIDHFIVDGGRLDEVMNAANTNLVFVAYITSTQMDNSTVGVMLIDPRTGHATYYPTQGRERAMATKSAAENAILQAVNPYAGWSLVSDGNGGIRRVANYPVRVEDLTLHTIYGVRTWEGVLTRPAFDNSGRLYGSLYAGTVLLRADYDVNPSGVVWSRTLHQAFAEYEERLYLRTTQRAGSNVLEDREVEGEVSEVVRVVVEGRTHFLLSLAEHDGERWDVSLEYIGDINTEDVLRVDPGDRVRMRYGDPHNRRTYIVREIRLVEEASEPEAAPSSEPEPAVHPAAEPAGESEEDSVQPSVPEEATPAPPSASVSQAPTPAAVS